MDSALAATLVELGVATVHEAAGRRGLITGVQLLIGAPFAGQAVTVALPAGDNLGLHIALERAEPHSVVCAASAGRGLYGVAGELLVEAARARAVAALVLDDGIRDAEELAPPPAIAARGFAAQGTVKRRERSRVGCEIAIGGTLVRPGDWIVGDRDGIVAVDAGSVADLVVRAEARRRRERNARERLRRGEPSRSVFGLRHNGRSSVDETTVT